MNNYADWDNRRGKIISKKGGWKVAEKIECHGLDLMDDAIGQLTYMQVVILNATGRLVGKSLADWFEAVHICMSWPDARIWCNRIGALGGSAGASTVASACAGIMAADSKSYGTRPIMEGVKFISEAYKAVCSGESVEKFVANEVKARGGKPHLMGYARPIVKGDERITVLDRLAKKLGFERGPHLALAYQIEEILDRDYGESMNLNGYVSAFITDQEFSAIEVYRICAVVLSSGVVACNVDYADRIRGSFVPMWVDDVDYAGVLERTISE